LKPLLRSLGRTLTRYREHEGPRIAASIAFYVLFSAVPSVALLILSVGWAIHDPRGKANVLGHMLEILPVGSAQNRTFLTSAVDSISKASGGLSVMGVLGLAWSSLGMFSAARWGLDRAWGVRGRPGFAGVRLRDVAAAMGIWLLLLISAIGTAAIHMAFGSPELPTGGVPGGPDPAGATIQWTMPALLSFGAFLYLYWYVPNVQNRFRDVLPSAVVATLLFEVSKYLFGLYVTLLASHSALYGALGGILGFMLWVYVCSSILLLGAEFAWVHRHRRAGEL
jgi:membrane protein